MTSTAEFAQLVNVIGIQRGLREVSKADHLGDEQRVPWVRFRLTNVKAANGIGASS